MGFPIFGSFRERLDTNFITAIAQSGGSTTQVYNYNYYFQFQNRAGKNLLSSAIALTVNAGEKAVFTFADGSIASGEEVIWIIVSAENTGNKQDEDSPAELGSAATPSETLREREVRAVQLARIAVVESDQVTRRSLPLTLELSEDIHFALQRSVADYSSLPSVADLVFGTIYLVVDSAQYYLYDEWSNDWIVYPQGQSTYLSDTTAEYGCDRVLSDVDSAVRVPTKIGDTDTVPLRLWWLNGFWVDGLSPQVANTVLSFEFAVNGSSVSGSGKSYNAIFANRVKVTLVGYVERATGILDTSVAQSQLIWNPVTNPLLLPVDLPRGYAAVFDVILSFDNEQMQGIIPQGATIELNLVEAFENVGIPSPVAKTTGDLVFAEGDRLRIVPAPLRLSGSATSKAGYIIDSKKEIPFPGLLAEDTAEQKICLSGSLNGFVTIRQPGEELATDEVIRAIASTETGKGQISDTSITLSANSAVEITINFPERVRDDYPDVIAGNTKATFTPVVGRIGVSYNSVFYQENATRILGKAEAITFVLSDLTDFTVSTLHTPDADFDLFHSEITATQVDSSGTLGGTYTFYFWHEYETPNTLITRLSHDPNDGVIPELIKSLAEIDGDMSTSTYDIDEDDAIDIAAGGTSAKTAAEALANLGGINQAQLDQAIANLIAQGLGSPYFVFNDDSETRPPFVTGINSIGVGDNAQPEGDYSVAFGIDSYAGGLSSIAFGKYTFIQGDYSLAFGENANIFANNAIQLGQGANNDNFTLQFFDTKIANSLSLEVAKVASNPNGTITARVGTLLLDTSSGFLYVNTDGLTAWTTNSGTSGTPNASSVAVAGTPTNYSPDGANVQAHLSAIDLALASTDGGSNGGVTDFTSFYAQFNEAIGATTFVDSSIHAHIMTTNGAALSAADNTTVSGTTSLFGVVAGTGDYIDIAPTDNLKLADEDFTLELWVFWAGVATTEFAPVFWSNRDASNIDVTFGFFNNELIFAHNDANTVTFPFVPTVNTWHHICYTREGTNLRCFVDGNQVGTTFNLVGAINDRSLPIRLIGDGFNGINFPGFIDEMRLLKGKALYTSNFTVPSPPLGLYTEGSSNFSELTGDRIYYASPTGDDNNDGLSATSPKTIQGAIDTAADAFGSYNITLQLADGTYAIDTTILLKTPNLTGKIIIQGSSANPANVILDGAVDVIRGDAYNGRYSLKDFTLQTSSGNCIYLLGNKASILEIDSLRFGSCTNVHLALEDGNCSIEGSYEIFGSATYHVSALSHAFINYTQAQSAIVVTLTGTPNFSGAFAIVSRLGILVIGSAYATFSGSATGARYIVSSGGILDTGGEGTSYLPGNAGGSTATVGQYL